MILECPSCHARFEIGAAVDVAGRKVRCSRCAHIWKVGEEPALEEPVAAAPPEAPPIPPQQPQQPPVQYRPDPAQQPVRPAPPARQMPNRDLNEVAGQFAQRPTPATSAPVQHPEAPRQPVQHHLESAPVDVDAPVSPSRNDGRDQIAIASPPEATTRVRETAARKPEPAPQEPKRPKREPDEVSSAPITQTTPVPPKPAAPVEAAPPKPAASAEPVAKVSPPPQADSRAPNSPEPEPAAPAPPVAKASTSPQSDAERPDTEPETREEQPPRESIEAPNDEDGTAIPSLETELGDLFATPPAPPPRPEPNGATGFAQTAASQAARTEPTFDNASPARAASPNEPSEQTYRPRPSSLPQQDADHPVHHGESDLSIPADTARTAPLHPDDQDFATPDQIAPDPTMSKSHIDISADSPFATDFSEPVGPSGSRARRGQHVQDRLGRRRIIVNAGWFCIAAVIGSVIGLAWLAPGTVVRALPGTAKLYSAVGQTVNTRGLDFEDVSYTWTQDAGRPALDVTGKIRNVSEVSLRVPTVVFVLLDEQGDELYNWASPVVKEPLAAGTETEFSARVPAPPEAARRLRVRFARKSR